MRRFLAFLPVLLLAALIAAAGFVLLRGEQRAIVTDGAANRVAPVFSLERLGGGAPLTSAEFAGRPHLINLYASWCTPCRAEHPVLMQLKQSGVPIIGIAYKDRPENTSAFLARLGDPFAVTGLDPDGRFGLELGIAGVPETFVIGADGRIRAVHRGPLTTEVVAERILPALNGD